MDAFETEIQETAEILIAKHGSEALERAANNAAWLEHCGYREAACMWRQIELAIQIATSCNASLAVRENGYHGI